MIAIQNLAKQFPVSGSGKTTLLMTVLLAPLIVTFAWFGRRSQVAGQ